MPILEALMIGAYREVQVFADESPECLSSKVLPFNELNHKFTAEKNV
jgi:hypothetical protein